MPTPGSHVHMTAGQMLIFARHSPAIFALLKVPATDPALECWLTHLTYLNILMQHEITQQDIINLEALIKSHQNQISQARGQATRCAALARF